MAGKTADTILLELDDLLEKSHSNIPHLKLEYVTLDVNLTLHLLNRYVAVVVVLLVGLLVSPVCLLCWFVAVLIVVCRYFLKKMK